MISATDFLVVCQQATDVLKAATGNWNMTEPQARACFLGALRNGVIVGRYQSANGPCRRVELTVCDLRGRIELIDSYDRNGKPQLAPDGVKTIVLLVDFQLLDMPTPTIKPRPRAGRSLRDTWARKK